MRRSWRTLGLLVAVLGVGACAAVPEGASPAPPAAPAPPGMLRAVDVTAADPPDVDVAPLSRGTAALGHDLLQLLLAEPSEGPGVVVSPFSISTAFAMLRVGARGETAAELDRVLHLPTRQRDEQVARLVADVVTQQGPPPRTAPDARRSPGQASLPPVVAVANALWVQHGMSVEADFLRTLARAYGTGARTVDFTTPAAKQQIDAWVQQQTADRITELFRELPPETLLVLANAVYLKADWEAPFPLVDDAPFTRADGSTVDVPTMRDDREVRYAAGRGWQAVELPYAGGELAMQVIVPTGSEDPRRLLSPQVLGDISASLRPRRVAVALPRFELSTTLDLRQALAQLGAVTAMGGGDYSGIAHDLRVDQAVHRAIIDVDEHGTEAAAVTAVPMVVVSGGAGPDVALRADRPFAFAVVHRPTGTPLFEGVVGDPSIRP